jgi:phosphoribosylglycinamide formyltransferase 1
MKMMKKLYDPENGQMMVAGLMSGSGSNIEKLIEHEQCLTENGKSPYMMGVIFTDNPDSNANNLCSRYGIPVFVSDMKKFYAKRGKPITDLAAREEFDVNTTKILKDFGVDAVACGGYMKRITAPLLKAFLCVNVHPADLSIMDGDKRKYTGDHAVLDAIMSGERYLHSTTHLLDDEVDHGRILMVSPGIQVEWPSNLTHKIRKSMRKYLLGRNQEENAAKVIRLYKEIADVNQDRLKKEGDWVIFPKTIQAIAEGRYSEDENGKIFLDGKHYR